MSSEWLRVALLLSEILRSIAWKTKKLASRTFIHDRQRKRFVLSIKDKNEDADDIALQMICKSVVSRSNVVLLNLISFARFCSSLIFIFSVIRTLDYPDYFVWSPRVRLIEVRLYLAKLSMLWPTKGACSRRSQRIDVFYFRALFNTTRLGLTQKRAPSQAR